jgi:hypothetical protein
MWWYRCNAPTREQSRSGQCSQYTAENPKAAASVQRVGPHTSSTSRTMICGGLVLDDIELHRTDAAFLDALGTRTIPDPTTAGDFCRRFTAKDIDLLMEVVNDIRIGVWKQQPSLSSCGGQTKRWQRARNAPSSRGSRSRSSASAGSATYVRLERIAGRLPSDV